MLRTNLSVRNKIFRSLMGFAWLATLGFGVSSLQADGPVGESPFIVDSWNTADGLSQSSVIALVQTHDGYLGWGR